jgi:hypothetical protein
LPELTQPAAVSLNGLRTAYGAPWPSVTTSITSLSIGAVSIGSQPNFSDAPMPAARIREITIVRIKAKMSA